YRLALGPVPDRLAAQYCEVLAEAHQHVSVIDLSAAKTGVKSHDPVATKATELAKRLRVGTDRTGCEGDPVQPVEDQAAGPLEVAASLLKPGQVDDPAQFKTTLRSQPHEEIRTTLGAPVAGSHRVQHRGAVVMGRHPVIRKIRVRGHAIRE